MRSLGCVGKGGKDDHSAVSGCFPLLWDRWDFWKHVPEACCQLGSWPFLLIFLVSQFIWFCVCPVISPSPQFLPWAQSGLSSPTSFVLASYGKRFVQLCQIRVYTHAPNPLSLEQFILSVGPLHSAQLHSIPIGNEKKN